MATLRELVSRLVVDDRKATKTLDRHDKQLKTTKRSMLELNAALDVVGKAFGAVRALVNGASRALNFFVIDVAKTGDTFAKEAKKIGTTATSLQELSFAAERAGADQTKLVKAVSRMAKNLNDARAKNIGPFRDALDQLGIPIQEFEGLSPDQTFERLATVIAGIEDPLVKAAIAQDIFGRSGRDLIPLLDEGAEGIRAYRERARELGLSMSDEAAAGSEVFVDSMTDLKAAVHGARFAIGAELMPVMTDIVERTTDWLIENKKLIRERVVGFVRALVETGRQAIPVLTGIVDVIKLIAKHWDILVGLFAAGKLIASINAISAAMGALGFASSAVLGPAGIIAAGTIALIPIMMRLGDSIGDAVFEMTALGRAARDATAAAGGVTKHRGMLAQLEASGGVGAAGAMALAEGLRTLDANELRRLEASAKKAGAKELIAQEKARRARAQQERAFGARVSVSQALTGRGKKKGPKVDRGLRAAEAVLERGGTESEAIRAGQQAMSMASGGRAGGGRGKTARAKGTTTSAPEEATADELLALAAAAVPGTDIGEIARTRKVPNVTAPVVTVTVNQTNVDVDVSSPITIEGVPGASPEEIAGIVVRRQASALDAAVRDAIETLQPAGVGR